MKLKSLSASTNNKSYSHYQSAALLKSTSSNTCLRKEWICILSDYICQWGILGFFILYLSPEKSPDFPWDAASPADGSRGLLAALFVKRRRHKCNTSCLRKRKSGDRSVSIPAFVGMTVYNQLKLQLFPEWL